MDIRSAPRGARRELNNASSRKARGPADLNSKLDAREGFFSVFRYSGRALELVW